ncbi:hypothetical protein D3C73_1081090 [compost metagenome]
MYGIVAFSIFIDWTEDPALERRLLDHIPVRHKKSRQLRHVLSVRSREQPAYSKITFKKLINAEFGSPFRRPLYDDGIVVRQDHETVIVEHIYLVLRIRVPACACCPDIDPRFACEARIGFIARFRHDRERRTRGLKYIIHKRLGGG